RFSSSPSGPRRASRFPRWASRSTPIASAAWPRCASSRARNSTTARRKSVATPAARLVDVDWPAVREALDAHGHAVLPSLLTADECASLARLFDDDARFRSTVDMARHRFGEGRYRYFSAPLAARRRALLSAAA